MHVLALMPTCPRGQTRRFWASLQGRSGDAHQLVGAQATVSTSKVSWCSCASVLSSGNKARIRLWGETSAYTCAGKSSARISGKPRDTKYQPLLAEPTTSQQQGVKYHLDHLLSRPSPRVYGCPCRSPACGIIRSRTAELQRWCQL